MEALSRQAYSTPQREQGSPRQATWPTGTHNVVKLRAVQTRNLIYRERRNRTDQNSTI
jgi:hypothetical protein